MLKFRYEILYRRIGDELTIHTAEVISRNSIEDERFFFLFFNFITTFHFWVVPRRSHDRRGILTFFL